MTLTPAPRRDGLAGLWRGLLAGLLMAPRPGLAFAVVERLQPALVRTLEPAGLAQNSRVDPAV
jgi:hypothetical protein